MRVLVDDFVQRSIAPDQIKTGALADKYRGSSFDVDLGSVKKIDCFGVGYTDATTIIVNGETYPLADKDKNGLYLLTAPIEVQIVTVQHNGTFIGRFGCGLHRFLGCAPAREPAFWSTFQNRRTGSGQWMPGAGGIAGRTINVDIRYKIDRDIFGDIETAYLSGQISKKLPWFVLFDKEFHRMPWLRFYGVVDEDFVLQSSVNYFLYSKRLEIEEAY